MTAAELLDAIEAHRAWTVRYAADYTTADLELWAIYEKAKHEQ